MAALAAGCADQVEKDQHGGGSITDRQDAAMKDPFSYGPSEGKSAPPVDAGKAKRDDSFKGESDRFWNP